MMDKRKVRCKNCGNGRSVIRKYHLFLCRNCFKELAEKMGFKKYD